MIKIIHTADQQLGAHQYGFAERDADYRNAFAYTAMHGTQLDGDLFLLAGDLFDKKRPGAPDVHHTQGLVTRLKKAGMSVIGIDGNHDATANQWLEVCGIEPLNPIPNRASVYTYEKGTGAAAESVRILGINNMAEGALPDLLNQFVADGAQADILVLHQLFAEICGFPGVTLTCEALTPLVKALGCKLVLLGDVHNFANIEIDGVVWTYCGSPERTAMNEHPSKSFSEIQWTPGKFEVIRHSIPIRPFLTIELKTSDDFEDLVASIPDSDTLPIALVYYNPEIPSAKERVRSLLAGVALTRLIPKRPDDNGDRVTAMLDALQRSGEHSQGTHGVELSLLTELEAQAPDLDKEVVTLMSAMLQQPEQSAAIAEAFFIRD